MFDSLPVIHCFSVGVCSWPSKQFIPCEFAMDVFVEGDGFLKY
jgi:hypothetical protein